MKPTARLESIKFSDGTIFQFDAAGIVVFVGPNNAGKSVALREIRSQFENHHNSGIVVNGINLKTSGSVEDVYAWLQATARRDSHNHIQRFGGSIYEGKVKHDWTNKKEGVGELTGFFCCLLTTDRRLSASDPAPNIKLTTEPLEHPIHYMQLDDAVELRISKYFRKAFGQDLVVHRNAGEHAPLLCGQKPSPKPGEDRLSFGYVTELEKLPPLHQQGDGMKSFAGVVLYSLTVDHDVLLIDEPEAFLHPPQAHLLGRMLAKEVTNRQLFLATHSGDLLRGLLDANVPSIRVVRIRRNGNVNVVSQLDHAKVQQLWGDPLLRHSNVLDGLFHEKVIVCEGDADCRFYAAVLDSIYEANPDTLKPDIMFVHCGGKDRIPTVVGALKAVGVPVGAIVDFDIFNSEHSLREICEKLGGAWQHIGKDWRLLKSSIDQKKPELSATEVRADIQSELAAIPSGCFPKETAERIQKILRRASPWSVAKTVGKQFVPSGDPTQACDRLLQHLRSIGLFVVELGQLEGFVRSIGGHGPSWVNSVLTQKNLLNDSELTQARDFIREVVG